MATKENAVKAAVKKLLDKYEVYYFMPPANGYGRTGIPDIIACVDGYFVAIECKAGNNKPTPLQEREMAKIIAAGGEALVVNDDPRTMAVLENLLEVLTWSREPKNA